MKCSREGGEHCYTGGGGRGIERGGVCCLHCILCILQCTVFTVQCFMHSVQCAFCYE